MDTVAVSSLTEWAKASGFGTAVITSVGINHATPGCFVAHTTRRQNYEDISTQYVNSSGGLCRRRWLHYEPSVTAYSGRI